MTRRCVNDRTACRGMATPAVLRATYRSRATHLYVATNSWAILSDQIGVIKREAVGIIITAQATCEIAG